MRLILLVALLGLAACATRQPAAADEFRTWLDGVRHDAAAAGVAPATIDAALAGVAPLPAIVSLDRRQPESVLTFAQYVSRIVTPSRVEKGRELMRQHGPLLHRIESKYGVSASVIVALWAMESSYGQAMGDYRVVDALVTLAYDGRRPDFFRGELIDALKILDRGRFRSSDLIGSWAGAMGQTQFMPSTYLKYAVDYGHSGPPDIWRRLPDVFASAANYLTELGWQPGQSWGREVRLLPGLDPALIGPSGERPLDAWRRLGVRRDDGRALPKSTVPATLVAPDGPDGRAFLVSGNFGVLKKWNHSTNFALAVGLLADAVSTR